jgi:mycothiol system anti-sigma-R factor
MSCGSPHETDCREVLEEVYLYLDGEVDSSRRDLIREHLDECAPCLRKFGLEQAVKVLVARSCGRDRAPESLRISVLTQLRQVRIEIDHAEYRAE